jgi:hypothetical protein
MQRLLSALNAFWRVLRGHEEPPSIRVDKTESVVAPIPAAPRVEKVTAADKHAFEHGAVYALVLLQRHGRLIDFLQEKLDDYSDEQIGAASRQIHHDCQSVFKEHIHVQRIMTEEEGATVKIGNAVDPLAIKLTGAIPSAPPYKGILRHKGWKIGKMHLPERSDKVDPYIIAAAEVEID